MSMENYVTTKEERIMKKILFLALMAMGFTNVKAENECTTTLGADFVNQYIWRGQDLGNVSLQPTMGVGYKGLSLTAWGSVGLANTADTKEFDITASYTIGGFSVGITDYWFSVGLDPDGRYFRYNAHSTNHIFEAFAGYNFGVLSVNWFTNFAGNDGTNGSGKRAYSSYFVISAPFHFASVDWKATAGASPYATSLYGTTGFAVTNLSLRATKDIKITESFSIPVFGQLTGNPCSQKAYLVFGFTLQP